MMVMYGPYATIAPYHLDYAHLGVKNILNISDRGCVTIRQYSDDFIDHGVLCTRFIVYIFTPTILMTLAWTRQKGEAGG